MKKVIISIILAAICFSCERSTNYSVQKEAANKKIAQYIKDKGFVVIKNFPVDSVFVDGKDSLYFNQNVDSIYFRLLTKGLGKKVELNDRLQIRYIESTLDNPPLIESYWTTLDLANPIELVYNPEVTKYLADQQYQKTNTDCVGWQSAIRMMGRADAVAEFIVPPPIGLAKAESATTLTPYIYKFKFKILPK
ncbi:MAG: DUF4827 domain-containing protein [Prevotellaceae bacterium]|jgi:hypothetical protein|nr:DUF4827 domain-containing protein [Prevotellaceae bacterium]